MKKLAWVVIFLLIGFLIGWFFGFLRLPYLTEKSNFWIGFISSAGLSFGLFGILKIKRNISLLFLAFMTSCLIGLIINYLIDKKEFTLAQSQALHKAQITEKSKLLFDETKSQQLKLVDEFMSPTQKMQLKQLDSNALNKLFLLSEMLEPLEYAHIQSFNSEKRLFLSPGRGYLLKKLLVSDFDTLILNYIFKRVSFANADLMNSSFNLFHLKNIQLKHANLSNSNFKKVDLSSANLKGVYGENVNISESNLNGVDLENAELPFLALEKTSMRESNQKGLIIRNGIISDSDFSKGEMIWTILDHTYFKNCDFLFSDLFRSSLKFSSFINCDFGNARISKSYLQRTNFNNSDLSNLVLRKSRFEQPKEEEITNWNRMKITYNMVVDSSKIYSGEYYKLQKK